MPGKLVHTNEILVLLGDNWFVERSAKQSCDIVRRRLEGIGKHLENLHKEMQIFTDQLNWTNGLIKVSYNVSVRPKRWYEYFIFKRKETGEYVNIEEKFEEKENYLAKNKQLTDDEKQKQRIELQNKARLAQLRINQRIENERLSRQNKSLLDDEKDDDGDSEEEKYEVKPEYDDGKAATAIMDDEKTVGKKSVRWVDSDMVEVSKPSRDSDDSGSDYVDSSDDSIYEVASKANNIIQITHTKPDNRSQTLESSAIRNTAIQTPADIYKCFYKPKSILKNHEPHETLVYDHMAVDDGGSGITKQVENVKSTFDAKLVGAR